MVRNYKWILCSLLCVVVAVSSMVAEDWFVCLSSFKNKENALRYQAIFEENSIPSFIDEYHDPSGTTYYRVLLSLAFADADDAFIERDILEKVPLFVCMEINDLWVCQAPAPVDTPQASGLPPEKPYSVLVRSYKDEPAAEHCRDRLEQLGIPARVLKKYDDTTVFSFDVHAGEFDTQAEAEALQTQVASLGIAGTSVSEYAGFAEALKKYASVARGQLITFNNGQSSVPASLSSSVRSCLHTFPVNPDFQLEALELYDFDNIWATESDVGSNAQLEAFIRSSESVHAAAFARYRDDLFEKELSVFIAEALPHHFDTFVIDFISDRAADWDSSGLVELAIAGSSLKAFMVPTGENVLLAGINADGSLCVCMQAKKFTQEQFVRFLNSSYEDTPLLLYPQVRRTLFALPDDEADGRSFLSFKLERVTDVYAEERGYADWSLPMLGHWQSEGCFAQGGAEVRVSFFDLDYDYTARYNHQLFMKEKAQSVISDENHSGQVMGQEAWYWQSPQSSELSFFVKSYIIAVGSYDGEQADEATLTTFAEGLRVWE